MLYHGWNVVIFSLIIAFSASIAWPQVPPGFPRQPMIIHGEVLVNGKAAATGSVVEAHVGSTIVAKTTINDQFGFSSYVLEIKTSAHVSKESRLTIKRGDYSADGSLIWKEGDSAKKDILTNSTLNSRVTIKSTTAIKDTEGWELQCEFDPLQQEGISAEAVTYRLRWYISQGGDGEDEQAKLIKENTVSSTETKQTFSLEASVIPDSTGFLHLVITPILNNGEFGPSRIKKIKIVLKEAEM